MKFKFSPGDEIIMTNPRDSGWTVRHNLRKGAKGTVVKSNKAQDGSNVVRCCFPGVSDSWWVYEDELEFAEEPISVDTSSLL